MALFEEQKGLKIGLLHVLQGKNKKFQLLTFKMACYHDNVYLKCELCHAKYDNYAALSSFATSN